MARKVPPPPPSRGRGGRTPNVPATTGTAVVDVAGVARTKRAVFRAYVLFVEDPDATIADVHRFGSVERDDPASPRIGDCVTLETLYETSKRESWVEQKREFWKGVRNRVLAKAQSSAIERELEEVNDLDRVRTTLLSHIEGDKANGVDAVKPRTLEGAVRSLVLLDQRVGQKRQVVARSLSEAAAAGGADLSTTGGGGARVIPHMEDGFDEADIEAAAREVVRRRAGIATDGGGDG